MSLQGQRILLGVSGGIAAYKSAELCRLLIKAGAEVQVVMTAGAQAFITPLTFQALTGRATRTQLLDESAEQGMGHIELARWATRVLVAPASANLLARLRMGMADDLLTTVVLASRAPLAIAPAMNQGMWANAAVKSNVAALTELYSPLWIGPDAGEQACGDVGAGRMSEPSAIVAALGARPESPFITPAWAGKRVVITAGPTREAIDPVRYLTNHSSGQMGFALATAAAEQGAEVTLIAGPVTLPTPVGVTRIDVVSAADMLAAARESAPGADLFIGAAAVADYRVCDVAGHKLKKTTNQGSWNLAMVENTDIIATVANLADRPTIVVGFAAETRDLEIYAREKREKKGLDWVVANDISRTDIGFNSAENQVTVFGSGQQRYDIRQQSKITLAAELLAVFARETRK